MKIMGVFVIKGVTTKAFTVVILVDFIVIKYSENDELVYSINLHKIKSNSFKIKTTL